MGSVEISAAPLATALRQFKYSELIGFLSEKYFMVMFRRRRSPTPDKISTASSANGTVRWSDRPSGPLSEAEEKLRQTLSCMVNVDPESGSVLYMDHFAAQIVNILFRK
jgi:hypothetical protein